MKKTTSFFFFCILKKSSVNSNKTKFYELKWYQLVIENENKLINVRNKNYTFNKKKISKFSMVSHYNNM